MRVIVFGDRAVVQAYAKQARVSQNGSCRRLLNGHCLVGWHHLLCVWGGSAPELTREQGPSDLSWTILLGEKCL